MRKSNGCVSQWVNISGKPVFMKKWGVIRILWILAITVFFTLIFPVSGRADDDPRNFDEEVTVNIVHWQLARWNDGVAVCDLYLRHETQPVVEEVAQVCGRETANAWLLTPPCGGNVSGCSGLLLRQIGKSTYTYTRHVNLPSVTMYVTAINCNPGEWCTSRPEVRVVAEEPLTGHQIIRVHLRIGDREKIYDGSDAILQLPLTNEQGASLEYWAESDFGDESDRFAVKFRSVKEGEEVSYRFDLLNDASAANLPGGALLWDIFPPANGSLPKLFERPLSAGYLATTNRYAYLAGHLIRAGKVNASNCADGGIYLNGFATQCGEQASAEQVLVWQNKFDSQIYEASLKYNVPPRVLKGVIAQESQFWPESSDPYERGLGYITEDGVSMLLLWNRDYYLSQCIPIYGLNGCSAGYSSLQADRQVVLRRAVFNKISTKEEIDLLAAMLYASAAQTKQMVVNVARTEPANISTYEDMWKMSISNYYSGSGCLGTALRSALKDEKSFSWDEVSPYLLGDCQIAKDYVHRVFLYADY
jgi:hypothetical protein